MHAEDIEAHLLRLVPFVRSLVERRLRRWPDDAEDVTQDVLLVLLRRTLPAALRSYDPARGPLESFLRQPIERQITTELRKLRTRKRRFTTLDIEHEDEQAASDSDGTDVIEFAKRSLKLADARLLDTLSRAHSDTAAAAELGITRKSLTERKSKLKRRLLARIWSRSDEQPRKAA